MMPRALVAATSDSDEWHEAFVSAWVLALVQNVLLIDSLKVLCLTATCVGGPVEGWLARRCRWMLKPLRKLYKLMDMAM